MRLKLLLLSALLTVLVAAIPAGAQSEIVITLALNDFMRNMQIDSIFDEFEAQHPGVRVQPVYVPFETYTPIPATDDLDDHLNAVEDFSQSADVLLVESNNLTPEGTRAGYFLDLQPLTSADATLNPADYLPAAWESFRWDNGLWALPARVEPLMLIYDSEAFDQAGLAYPNQSWTQDDLANAARVLTQRNAANQVTMPGLVTFGNEAALLRSLYGQSLNDTSASLSVPRFATPELQALLEAWAELAEEGIVADSFSGNPITETPPMQISGSFGVMQISVGDNSSAPLPELTENPQKASALPGGSVALDVGGFAVSSGTAHPQEAYQLAKFLTSNPQIITFVRGSRPALNSLVGTPNQPINMEGGMTFVVSSSMSPEQAAAIEALLPSALPASEFHFGGYLRQAVEAVIGDNVDAATALQDAELAAIANLQAASDRRGSVPLVVATPVPPVVLNPGEISLRFGAGFTAMTGEWEALMREFAAADPQVGNVVLDTGFGNLSAFAERNDCFYMNYNTIPAADLSLLLAIDPYLSADSAFSPSDVAANALPQLQRDNHTWGFPLVIFPTLLNYHADTFARAGVPEPTSGWTVSAFVEALRTLKNHVEAGKTPFVNRGFGDTYLLMLIAAYGGLPIDYRTNPPQINFTDPATVDAIRQVLDLAKDELISYQELGGNGMMISSVSLDSPDPIYSDSVSGGQVMRIGGPAGDNSASPYRLAAYPSGTYTTAAYTIGAGYISANAQNPDACYRLLRFLSSHPELFDGMPALRSQFSNPALLASKGSQAADFYLQYDAVLQNPNTLIFPSTFTGGASTAGMNIIHRWLDQAFDDYVLRDADLLTALTDAQNNVTAFQDCVTGLPPYDAADPAVYATGLRDCASAIDPDFAVLFGAG